MDEEFTLSGFLRLRGTILLLSIIFLLILQPTAMPNALINSINRALAVYQSDNPELAYGTLKIALELEPSLATALDAFALRTAFEAGFYEDALSFLDDNNGNPPEHNFCLRIRTLLAQNRVMDGLRLMEEQGMGCPELGPEFYEKVQNGFGEETLDDYLDSLQKLASLGILPPDGWQQLGIGRSIENPEEAIPILRLGLELGVENPELSLDLIRAIQEVEFIDDPSYLSASIAQVLIRYRKWTYALLAIERALEFDPEYAEAWAYYGTILDRLDQDGYQALSTAIELDPDNPTIHYLLAKHFLMNDDSERAIRAFRYALSQVPDNAAILADLGAAYSLSGDTDTALEYYRKAAGVESTDPSFWLLLADFSMAHGIEVEASGITAARIAYLLSAKMNPDALDSLGYGYYLTDTASLAEKFLIRALQIDPHHAEARYHLGLLYASQGEIPQARNELLLATRLDPAGMVGDLAERALENMDS
jgi:tetratricopeptide (TPR) repeat protein